MSSNPFEIDFSEQPDILRITLRGRPSLADLLRAVGTIIQETKSRSVWPVLCDMTALIPPLGAFERFEVGVELARAADPRMRLAVVARAELIDHIFENVARNRGASVAVFADEDAALQWLLGAAAE